MTREEMVQVVDLVRANWNMLNQPRDKQKAMYEAWWRFLENFEFEEVMAVIDDAILADSYPPRIGWVVRTVVDRREGGESPPSETDAWLEVQAVMDSISMGLPPDIEPHPMVKAALKRVRERVGERVTKQAFDEEYRIVLVEHYRQ